MGFYRHLLWEAILITITLISTVSIALAEIKENSLILNSNTSKSFESLIQQAEDLAEQSIKEEFTINPEANKISILISAERNGQIVPVLRSKVSRSQWQRDSRIRRWTRYFDNSGILLGFYNPSSVSSPASQSTSTPASSTSVRRRREDDPAFRDD
jgi:hypothetical protein